MNDALVLAFLFFAGSLLGWLLEFFFRNLISHNGPHGLLFINPGFCKGPYLPIYGIGLCLMFVVSIVGEKVFFWHQTVLIILTIGICMTAVEFFGGLFMLRFMNIRLWDYRNEKLNIMGIICPLFSLIWTALGAMYYLIVHKYALSGIYWLANNLSFSFFIGLFFGVFIMDFAGSSAYGLIIKKFGDEHDVVVKYEELKLLLIKKNDEDKINFWNQFRIEHRRASEFLENFEHLTEKKIEVFKKKAK